MKKIAVMAIAFLLFIPFASINGNNVSLTNSTNGNVLYVGGSGPNNYTSIQEAINYAGDGYTIHVYYGNYNESIVINKSISLIGIEQNGEKPIINGSINESKKVVMIGADNITFKNFIVIYGRGVSVKNANNCKIENNEIIKATLPETSTNYAALELYKSHSCIITKNIIGKTNWIGVHIDGTCSFINFSYNTVLSNEYKGIDTGGSYNAISHNNLTKNQDGIDMDSSYNCTISFNRIYYNDQYGMGIGDCSGISILNNTIYHHSYGGIYIMDSSYCIIKGNEIYNNSWGVSLEGSMRIPWSENIKNVVMENNIYLNGYGIYLIEGRENSFINNNLIDNDCNAGFNQALELDDPNPVYPIHNIWDKNYWSDWSLSLPKPIKGKLEIVLYKIGIGFVIPAYMFDKHPAMEPYGNFTLEMKP